MALVGRRKDGTEFPVEIALSPVGGSESGQILAMISDITDRKRAEDALLESERKFRLLAENVAEVFWLIDPKDYHVVYANPAYEELWGRSCESLYEDPRSWLAAVHPTDIERVSAALERQAETGKFDEEFRIIRPDGSIRWVWDRGYAVEDASGHVQHMVGVAVDITDRNQAEEALAQSERRLRQVTEHISEIVWLTDPVEGKLLYVSPAYEKIWGRSCQSLYDDPRSWLRAVHPDDLEYVKSEFGKPEEGFDQEYRIIRPDGSVRWIWDRGFAIGENGDGQLRTAGITADITDRKQAEAELTLQARVLENMSEGVSVFDGEKGTLLVTNPTFDEMFGYERGELINQHASVLNAEPEENTRVLESIQTQLEQTGSWRGESNNIRKDGTLFTTSAHISALEVSGKTYLISVQEDITEREQAAEALRQSAQRNASLIDAIPDMMFTLDRRGVYLDFVPAQGQEPYISADEFLGKTVSEVLPAALALDVMRGVGLALDTGRQQELAYELNVDDEKHEYEVRILKSKEDEALAIVRDVTAAKRLEREEELRKARDELEGTVEKVMLGKNPYGLTFREFTVLHLAADGEADKAIADQLGISTFTVSKHVANILGKMAAASRTEACVRALREGLLT
jgi:PAS domain S-box-containing protein